MQNTYKILSLLLDYPNQEVKEGLGSVMDVIYEDRYLDQSQSASLQSFLEYAKAMPLSEWQKEYVQLFDFSTKNNLYLFDHIYGDSRERGQAMVDLTEMYNKSGFTPCSNELPDYLPLFLEYLSLLNNSADSERLLNEVAHIIKNMKKQLEKKDTSYFSLLDILCSLSESNKKKGVES